MEKRIERQVILEEGPHKWESGANKGSESRGEKGCRCGGKAGGFLQSAMVGGRERKKGRRAELSGVDWPV